MFDHDGTTNISIPSGPYPKCNKENCDGVLLPKVEPAMERGGMYMQEYWVKNTAVLFWKCTKCSIRI